MRVLLYIKASLNKAKAVKTVHISSKDNPKIKEYVRLCTNKKYRQTQRKFVLEGARVCRDAFVQWQNGELEISACFATAKAIEKYNEYLDRDWFVDDERFFTVDESVALKMTDSQFPQGVFLIAEQLDHKMHDDTLKNKGKYLILDDIQDPGNLGTLLRTAEAVGIDAVFMCNNCCELYNPKVLRSAVGTIFRTKIVILPVLNDVIEICHNKNIRVFASVIDSDADDIIKTNLDGGCAVVLGNEGNGLNAEDAQLCDKRITIKMRGNTNSLNVASAGSIIMWEMCRGDQDE